MNMTIPNPPIFKKHQLFYSGAFFAVWGFAAQIPKPQKTGLSAASPRNCPRNSCGLSAAIPCARPATACKFAFCKFAGQPGYTDGNVKQKTVRRKVFRTAKKMNRDKEGFEGTRASPVAEAVQENREVF
jgi:hypothetical protein